MMDQECRFSFCDPDRVKTINQLLDKTTNDAASLGLRMENTNSTPKISMEKVVDSFFDDSKVVGREYDVIKIENLLINLSN